MARIRSIKPEFWTNEKIVDCSTTARLLFIGLWTFSDDRGVHPASSRRIKMQVFPGDEITTEQVDGCVEELIRGKLLREFSENGEKYWHIVGFNEHQKIEKPTYKYPTPPGWCANFQKKQQTDRKPIAEESSTNRRPFDDHSPPDRIGEETIGEERSLSGVAEVFGEIEIPKSLTPEELTDVERWVRSMAHDPTFFPGSPQLAEKLIQAARYKSQGFVIAELVSSAISGAYKQLYPGRKQQADGQATDYEQHPEWLAILKIMREHGRDEMTDDVEWRSLNMTKAQKRAKQEAFSSWEELERANRFDRKSIAKDYVLAFDRLIAQGVPHR
jgi:hypothetical protein